MAHLGERGGLDLQVVQRLLRQTLSRHDRKGSLTYATILLMSGVTPAFAAKHMGHTIQMFLTTYAKWIDGGQNAVEMGKLEASISPGASPETKRAL